MGENRVENEFDLKMQDVNKDIVYGNLDQSIEKLKLALDFYERHELTCDFINIFDKGSNVIEAATKRALFLEQLNRIIELTKKNKFVNTMTIYYRYYALAQAFYGAPKRGLEIILEAERNLEPNSGIFIELRNAKGLILTELKEYGEALTVFLHNFSETKRLDYTPGYRFVNNIGMAYRNLKDYGASIPYFTSGIEYDLKLNYILNALDAMIELSDVYLKVEQYDMAFEVLERASKYDELVNNQFLYKSYCEMMYVLLKKEKKYLKALEYHEILMSLEIQLNMDKYSGMIAELNMKYDMSEKEKEYAIIKTKNIDLELMGKKLENMNRFLKTTLEKSKEMQDDLEKKNNELKKTMASLSVTQEKLMIAEKRTVLDQMFINIAHHMSTPLGVMNTTISHMEHLIRKINDQYIEGQMSKGDLSSCIQSNQDSLTLLNESLKKIVGFVDTLRLYKSDDEDQAKDIDLKSHFTKLINEYKTTKGIEGVELTCPDNINLVINISLLNKCIDLISNKLIASSCGNSFDIEISKEINMVSIGLGDFNPCEPIVENQVESSLVDTYDFYIIETIVENLMNGRFIKFEDRGRDYFQFIFRTNS